MRRELIISLFLIVITFATFAQVLNHEFVNYDDGKYVADNPNVQEGFTTASFIWAFTSTRASNWHPLTWLSHILDFQLYGLNPRGHHLTSLLIHIVNTILLFFVLKRLTGAVWRSSFVACLFALHPLHVESVAWVAERKDVLSTLFWILTILTYARYVEFPRVKRYLLTLLVFTLGLLAKPMLVTLPFVLLLLDYWPLGRLKFGHHDTEGDATDQTYVRLKEKWSVLLGLIWEKAPFFALAAASSTVTFIAQRSGGAVESVDVIPIKSRIANALVSYIDYIYKMLWPQRLAVFYPHPGDSLNLWLVSGAGFLLVGLSVMVIFGMRRHPYVAVGWLWYLGTLVPVIGIVQVGQQAIADRYSYIPLIGLFIAISWVIPVLLPERWGHRKIMLVITTVILVSALMVSTWRQVAHWRNSVTLFEHALDVTNNNYLAHYNLGMALFQKGEIKRAENHFSDALKLKSNYSEARMNLGNVLMQQGQFQKAVVHYMELLEKKPDSAELHHNLGLALILMRDNKAAANHLSRAVGLKPDSEAAHNYLGIALARQGQFKEAVHHFSVALRLKPDYREAHINREKALHIIQMQTQMPDGTSNP